MYWILVDESSAHGRIMSADSSNLDLIGVDLDPLTLSEMGKSRWGGQHSGFRFRWNTQDRGCKIVFDTIARANKLRARLQFRPLRSVETACAVASPASSLAWVSTRDACSQLGVNRRTLQRWASTGRVASKTGQNGVTLYRIALTSSILPPLPMFQSSVNAVRPLPWIPGLKPAPQSSAELDRYRESVEVNEWKARATSAEQRASFHEATIAGLTEERDELIAKIRAITRVIEESAP